MSEKRAPYHYTRRPGRPEDPLTDRHMALLRYVVQYKSANDGISPSFAEIEKQTGFSRSLIAYYLVRLAKNGLIRFDGVRNIQITGGQWTPPESLLKLIGKEE